MGSALGLEDLEHGYGSSLTTDLLCFLVALTTISHVNTTPYTRAGKVTTSGKCAQSVEALLFFTTKRVRATVITGGPLNLRVSLERWIQLFTLGTWSRKDPPQSPRRASRGAIQGPASALPRAACNQLTSDLSVWVLGLWLYLTLEPTKCYSTSPFHSLSRSC